MEFRKMVLRNLFTGNNGETDMENILIDMGRGEDETYGKGNMETYITICEIDNQEEFAVCLRKLKQGLCINLGVGLGWEMGGRFNREGIYVHLWLIHVEV